MSYVKELLAASRGDAFLVRADMTKRELDALDLRLVQSIKRSGENLEIKFVDIAKLCEIAVREDALLREAESESGGVERLREILEESAKLLDDEED